MHTPPGTFVTATPTNLWAYHPPYALRQVVGRDESSVQTFTADVPDGKLSIIVSKDGGKWHISVAHRSAFRADGTEILTRTPTWDELKWAKYRLCPEDVEMAIIFPRATSVAYVNVHETCLHLWEV